MISSSVLEFVAVVVTEQASEDGHVAQPRHLAMKLLFLLGDQAAQDDGLARHSADGCVCLGVVDNRRSDDLARRRGVDGNPIGFVFQLGLLGVDKHNNQAIGAYPWHDRRITPTLTRLVVFCVPVGLMSTVCDVRHLRSDLDLGRLVIHGRDLRFLQDFQAMVFGQGTQ